MRRVFMIFWIIGLTLATLMVPSPAPADPKSSRELYNELEVLTNVLHLVREEYVEPVNDKEIIDGAIQGMLSTLDPILFICPLKSTGS